jgi:hypothetical protein
MAAACCVLCLDEFGSGCRGMRLCDRCVDGMGHVLCLAEWSQAAPDAAAFSCPLCRGPLTAHCSFLMHRHRARTMRFPVAAPPPPPPSLRGWPSVLFAVQVVLGFVSLSVSVGLDASGAPSAEELRTFGMKLFAADAAVIAFCAWRWLLWRQGPQPQPQPHWANRLSDSIAVALCCVSWVLYEAERLFGQEGHTAAALYAGGGGVVAGATGATRAAATTSQTLQASYLLLSYLLLYAFMVGAELASEESWRLQYLWSCFLYACILSGGCAGGGSHATHVYAAFTVTAGFWLVCTFALCRLSTA